MNVAAEEVKGQRAEVRLKLAMLTLTAVHEGAVIIIVNKEKQSSCFIINKTAKLNSKMRIRQLTPSGFNS